MKISDPRAKKSERMMTLSAHCDLPGLRIARFDNTVDLFVLVIPRRAS